MVFAWREADSRRHAYLEIAKLLLEAGAARTKAGRMQCLLTGFHVRVRKARYPSVELLSCTSLYRCGLSVPGDSMPQLDPCRSGFDFDSLQAKPHDESPSVVEASSGYLGSGHFPKEAQCVVFAA